VRNFRRHVLAGRSPNVCLSFEFSQVFTENTGWSQGCQCRAAGFVLVFRWSPGLTQRFI
jgi:hypothetical protein